MSIKNRHTLPLVSAALLLGLMLHSCQAFEQPPEGVLTPQELIFTSAAETLVANQTPVLTSTSPQETTAALSNGIESISPTPGEFQASSQTPGPTPALVLDFEDDFQDQGYWETTNEEDRRAYYAPGGFRIENHSEEEIFSSTVWLDYGDVRVEVSADQIAGPESAKFGVVCRWQDEDNFYAFLIDQSGGFAIARKQDGNTSLLEQGSLEMERPAAGQSWRIAGSCLGHRLILELDGQVLAETRDEAFPVGLVGLAVSTRGEAGAEVSFKGFKAFTPVLGLAPFPSQTTQPRSTAFPMPSATGQATPTARDTALPSPTALTQLPDTPIPTPLTTATASPVVRTQAPTETGISTTTTPAPDATSVTGLIFEDDFSIRGGWHTETQPGFEMVYQGGGYRIHGRNPDSNVSSLRTFDHRDIVVDVDAALVSGPLDGYYGVVCRSQNLNNLYAFVVGSTGFHAILKVQNREVTFLEEGRAENGPVQTGGGVNRIRGICQGSLLVLEVNGQRLLETEDLTFASGNVGLLVGTQALAGNLVHFDNFALFAPLEGNDE